MFEMILLQKEILSNYGLRNIVLIKITKVHKYVHNLNFFGSNLEE